jgi:hypothetical protein
MADNYGPPKIIKQPTQVPGNPNWQEVRFDRMMNNEQLMQMMAQMFPGQGDLAVLTRMCDSCNQRSDDGNVEGHCQKCDTGFDLCSVCQKDPLNSTTECPQVYGCKEIKNRNHNGRFLFLIYYYEKYC